MTLNQDKIKDLLVICFKDVLKHPTASNEQLEEMAERILFTITNFKPYIIEGDTK